MEQIRGSLLAAALLATIGLGCSGSETETRSMEQIYAEKGVPVRTVKVEPRPFSSGLEFNAVLTGIEESSEFASISDRVDKITAKVGDYVKKDSVIIMFPADNPAANYYQAKVQYENALATYNRMKDYFATGGLSRQAFDNAEAAFRVAEANWQAVSQSILVRAPISGTLSRIDVRESDNAHKDDELFTVSRIDRLKASVWVPDTEIDEISLGMPVQAVWDGRSLNGHVTQVDRSLSRQHQAFGVDVELTNVEPYVQSGVTATISITTYTSDSALVTARKNVLTDDAGAYVFVIQDSTAHRRRVQLGASHLLDVEIAEGLRPGDQLVVEGQTIVKDGSKVAVLSPKEKKTAAETGQE